MPPDTHPKQSVEKGKMTADAAAAEAKAVGGRITYSLDLKDLKDADLVIEVRTLRDGLVGTLLALLGPLPGIGGPAPTEATAAPTNQPANQPPKKYNNHKTNTGHRREPGREDPLLQAAGRHRQARGHLRVQHLLPQDRRLRAPLRPPGEICESRHMYGIVVGWGYCEVHDIMMGWI